jgi:hypothetical protein
MTRRPLIANQHADIALGVALTLAGSFLLWDAYGRRGKRKPLALRAIGLVG